RVRGAPADSSDRRDGWHLRRTGCRPPMGIEAFEIERNSRSRVSTNPDAPRGIREMRGSGDWAWARVVSRCDVLLRESLEPGMAMSKVQPDVRPDFVPGRRAVWPTRRHNQTCDNA